MKPQYLFSAEHTLLLSSTSLVLNVLCLLPLSPALITYNNKSGVYPFYPGAFVRLIILTVGHCCLQFCGDWTFVNVEGFTLFSMECYYIIYTTEVKGEEQMKCTWHSLLLSRILWLCFSVGNPQPQSFHTSKRNRERGQRSDVIVACAQLSRKC